MSVLYYCETEYRTELVADFRSIYGTSFYDTDLDEALDLIPMLLKKSETLFYSKWHDTNGITLEARLLQSVQNAVIASIPTKKGEEWKKKDAMVQLPKPVMHTFNDTKNDTEAESKARWERAGWGRLADIKKKHDSDRLKSN